MKQFGRCEPRVSFEAHRGDGGSAAGEMRTPDTSAGETRKLRKGFLFALDVFIWLEHLKFAAMDEEPAAKKQKTEEEEEKEQDDKKAPGARLKEPVVFNTQDAWASDSAGSMYMPKKSPQ